MDPSRWGRGLLTESFGKLAVDLAETEVGPVCWEDRAPGNRLAGRLSMLEPSKASGVAGFRVTVDWFVVLEVVTTPWIWDLDESPLLAGCILVVLD